MHVSGSVNTVTNSTCDHNRVVSLCTLYQLLEIDAPFTRRLARRTNVNLATARLDSRRVALT